MRRVCRNVETASARCHFWEYTMLLGAFIITLITLSILNIFGDFYSDVRNAIKLQLVIVQLMLFFIAFTLFLIAWNMGIR